MHHAATIAQAFHFGPCVIYARGIQQYTVWGWFGIQFLAGDDCGKKGQHNVESLLRSIMLC